MRSLGSSLTLKRKQSLLFANKFSFTQSLFKRKHQLCTSQSCFSSYTPIVDKDKASLVSALTFSANSKSVILGSQVHGHIVKLGFSNDTYSLNNLIKMYSYCGVLSEGLRVFGEMPERNLVSWTLIISGAIQNDDYKMALGVYLDMKRSGLMPNEFAIGSVMKVCTSMGATELGLCVHSFSLKIGMEKNPFVASSVLHMYANCGMIEAAKRVFECIDGLDTGCWNAMIGGYVQCGHAYEALQTASLMHCKGMIMDRFTFINALKGCSVVGDLNFGRQVHGLIVQSNVKLNTSVINSLMDMYFKNGEKSLALKLFSKMQDKDVVSWNTMFAGYSHDVDAREAAGLFNNFMCTPLKPNYVTFSVFFRLCGEGLKLDLGLQFFSLAFRFGFHGEPHVVSSQINMFSRCGALEMARVVFDSIPFKNINNWNEMISGYNLSCDLEALKLFRILWEFGVEANECTFSSALEACSKTGKVEMGRQIHGVIVKSGFASHGYVCGSLIKGYVKFRLLDDSFEFLDGLEKLDMVSWAVMISTLVRQGCICEAINILNRLKEGGEEPDEFILASIFNGCASIASHHQTKSVHSLAIKIGFETNVFVASAIIDAYAKCGNIESARTAFHQSSRFHDAVLFNTMIMAYVHHGLVKEAMEMFEKMKLANLQLNEATFVSVILACGHMGVVDQGWNFFKSITVDYGMEPSPDNYGCLVDLLSRNGFLQEAICVIEAMPFPPWPAIWRSLLNGCRIHGDSVLGKKAADKLLQLVPNNDAAYVLLSNIYSEDGNWDSAAKVRKGMIAKGVRKESGCSWVEIQ
ncbi:pentatricopeptide repeat-containing protein At3g09040, mitochondrial-like [Cornus florida]|uniref:pentatricopeptide repeat-containing protein At3g09040, mitochondrial-like n=1 Tax=Cornus florida TaxID=4283 RepID=UPI002896DEC8|nr:pentatricopeptide repeat-containing protein At3g09040, mitochondrial-like [Cornus florida]XP_059656503.1 pentatricopeptide repeat-containing protein At3g09040, mitochondrial-like [Cornus florida]